MPAEETDLVELSGPDGTVCISLIWLVSALAKRIRVKVPHEGPVRITIPHRGAKTAALDFLQKNRAWLLKALARRDTRPATMPVAEYLDKAPWVCVSGKRLNLECAETPVRPFFIYYENEEPVLFRHRGGLQRETDLLALLHALAAKTLQARVVALANPLGISIHRVSVRNQRGRWGSCSSSGTVSLNWRLLLLPPHLQDYVILHELAHRLHMSHSRLFWAQLAKWDPNCHENDKVLSKQWGFLMDLGRAL
ncbi:MAG: M48 family metallopeptidase [Puniceicoccales bacterium]|jgi:predicted metal-dependent hydrolase|nr:M48 family metallopeptidase [Puniceicoccales bacterium]